MGTEHQGQSLATRPGSPAGLLFLAVWFALLASGIEAGAWFGQKALGLLWYLWLSPHFVWMGAVVDLLLFVAVGLVLYELARFFPRRDWAKPALVAYCFLLFSQVLFLSRTARHWAFFILAAGLAVQACRWLAPRLGGLQTVARRSLLWLVLLHAGLAAAVLGPVLVQRHRDRPRAAPPPAGSPNVLLIVMDTVRAANMSLHDYPRPNTTQLEHFAGYATCFDRAFSTASWTLPAHVSLFTGRYAHEATGDWRSPFTGPHPTLAEVLRDRGYLTAGFVANKFYTGWESGLDRGFGHFADYTRSPGEFVNSCALSHWLFHRHAVRRAMGYYNMYGRKSAADVNAEFLAWLAGQPRRPFFAFLNYYDAHDPYFPLPPFDGWYGPHTDAERNLLGQWSHLHKQDTPPDQVALLQSAYDGCIGYLDRQLGALFTDLERAGILQNTLVIVTSDHGEHLGEHGLFIHGNSLYRDLLHVPLVVYWPGRVPAGKRVDTFVSLRDVPATVLDLLGLGDDSPLPGNSLARCWSESPGSAPPAEPTLLLAQVNQGCYFYPNHGHSPVAQGSLLFLMRDGKYYIKNRGDESEELYDFVHDPREENNLALSDASEPLLAEFRQQLEKVYGFPIRPWREAREARAP